MPVNERLNHVGEVRERERWVSDGVGIAVNGGPVSEDRGRPRF